jgi:hypothetical protein
VGFGPSDDNPVRPLVDNPDVGVGIRLFTGAFATVPFDVGLSHRQRKVPPPTFSVVRIQSFEPFGVACSSQDALKSEKRVRANLLDQYYKRSSVDCG